MARGVNKVILVGNLGQDPETRYTQSGAAVTNFSLATSESWNNKETGNKEERTEWHRCVAFNRLGEVCGEYLRKGSKVYVEGQLRTRKWQDQSGQDRYTTEIVAREMQMLDSRGGEAAGSPPPDGTRSSAERAGDPPSSTEGQMSNTGKASHHPPAFPESDGYSGRPLAGLESFDDDIPF